MYLFAKIMKFSWTTASGLIAILQVTSPRFSYQSSLRIRISSR